MRHLVGVAATAAAASRATAATGHTGAPSGSPGTARWPRRKRTPASISTPAAMALLCTAVMRYDRQGRAGAGRLVVLRDRAVKLSVAPGTVRCTNSPP
ncbi:MAG TPA: hypothetical protein VH988_04900 [Thermoanaerobaculia bacterium]|nr:hypothetical protein [Thermoanaerobaculia bacterium]